MNTIHWILFTEWHRSAMTRSLAAVCSLWLFVATVVWFANAMNVNSTDKAHFGWFFLKKSGLLRLVFSRLFLDFLGFLFSTLSALLSVFILNGLNILKFKSEVCHSGQVNRNRVLKWRSRAFQEREPRTFAGWRHDDRHWLVERRAVKRDFNCWERHGECDREGRRERHRESAKECHREYSPFPLVRSPKVHQKNLHQSRLHKSLESNPIFECDF